MERYRVAPYIVVATGVLFLSFPAWSLIITVPHYPDVSQGQTTLTVGVSYVDDTGTTINEGDLPNGRSDLLVGLDKAGSEGGPAYAIARSSDEWAVLDPLRGIQLAGTTFGASLFVPDAMAGDDDELEKCCGVDVARRLGFPLVLDIADSANASVQAPFGNFATAHVQEFYSFLIQGPNVIVVPTEIDGAFNTCANSSGAIADTPEPFVSFDISEAGGASIFATGQSGVPPVDKNGNGGCKPVFFNTTLQLESNVEYDVSIETFAAVNGFNGVDTQDAQAVMDPTITFAADFPYSDQYWIVYSRNVLESAPDPLAGQGSGPPSSVPEPTTFTLLGIAVAGLAVSRRRKLN